MNAKLERLQIRVLCVDDHPLMVEGLTALVNHQSDMVLVGEASDAATALTKYRETRPDVTLMDLCLGGSTGIDAMTVILNEFPQARIIMLTMFEGDAEIRRALEAGACGYLLKTTPPAELLRVIRLVHDGKKYVAPDVAANLAENLGSEPLSPREIEVIKLVAAGNRNKEIAVRLFISEETVKVHLRNIMGKLSASDRAQAVAIAVRRGIIRL